MIKKPLICFFLGSLFVFSACEKEETPYTLPPSGAAKVMNVSMGFDYDKTIFLNIESGKTWQANSFDWELKFEASEAGFRVLMNGGKSVFIDKTNTTDFNETQSAGSRTWLFDPPSGNLDSTAIGDWRGKNEVFLIDLGSKSKGNRYRKFRLNGVDGSKYEMEYSDLDGSNYKTVSVDKESDRNFVYYSFSEERQLVNFEPPTDDWDVKFTRYRYVYYDMTPIVPYEVNGALINTNKWQVAFDKTITFEDLDVDFAKGLDFSPRKDAIGFDWKYFDFDAAVFVTNQNFNYVLLNKQGYYYKLRFIDFYDENGIKGNPVFELQRL